MIEPIKKRALKYVFDNIYSKELLPKQSFNEFRKQNMFFLEGLNIRQQQNEFESYCFYQIAKKVKLPINRSDIKDFFDLMEY